MTQDQVQDKRDGIDLLAGMTDEHTRKAIIRTFESRLSQYVLDLLSPELSDGQALWIRAKAIGVIETLDSMGVKMASVEAAAPIRRSIDGVVRQSLNQHR